MKICHATDCLPSYHRIWGGAEQACYRIINLLTINNVNVCVIGTKPIKKIDEKFHFYKIPTWEEFFNKKIIWRYERIKDLILPFDPLSFFRTLLLLKKIKPDILHLHRVNLLSYSLILSAKLLNIPTVISIYDYWCICPTGLLLKPDKNICKTFHGPQCLKCFPVFKLNQLDAIIVILRKIFFDFFLYSIDMFHVLSDSSAQILKNYGINPQKIKTIPLPISRNTTDDPGCEIEKGLLLFVGWIEYRKGLDIIVSAMPEILNSFPDTKLVAIGEMNDEEYLKKIKLDIKKYNLQNCVQLLGKLPSQETKRFIQKAEIVVIAEQWENMAPVILTEAMSYGKPIVAGCIGGIPELITDKENGLLARYDEPADFAKKIIWLLKNKETAKNFGKKAREKIKSLTDEEKTIEKFMEMYNELV